MSGATSALRAIASGTVAAPQYHEFVDKAQKKATKELENLKTLTFDDPIHETENQSHQMRFKAECSAFLKHYPYLCTLGHRLVDLQVKVAEDNEGFKKTTSVVSQEELTRLEKTSEEYSAEYYLLLTAIYEASAFAQNFFRNVGNLNTTPLTFASIEDELGKLKKVSLPESITAYIENTKQLQAVKDQRFEVAAILAAQVDKTMKVINKNLIKVIEKLGLYMQTVTYGKGVPLKNSWIGLAQSTAFKYAIPVPIGFAITYSESSSSSSTLSSKVSSVSSTSTLSSTTSSSTTSSASKLENKRKEDEPKTSSKGTTSTRSWTKKREKVKEKEEEQEEELEVVVKVEVEQEV